MNDNEFISIGDKECVNQKTGEIISYKSAINLLSSDKSTITKEINNKINKLKKENGHLDKKDTHRFNWNNNNGNPVFFVKKYKIFGREINKVLEVNEKALLFVLSDYIESETNQIIIDNNKYPTNKKIGELVGLKQTAISKTISSLKKKGVLATRGKGRGREIFLNPFLAFDGKDIAKETLDLFNIEY